MTVSHLGAIAAGRSDYMLDVAAQRIPGAHAVNKFGRNTAIAAITLTDMWDRIAQPIWLAPNVARIHDIASTDAGDDGSPEGNGAHTIRVWGLTSWDSPEVSEDVTLNGLTNVPTANAYVIIHRMRVLTHGFMGTNIGAVTATAQSDLTVTAQISANSGQTRMAIYGVPSTQKAYITNYYVSYNKAGGAAGFVDVGLLTHVEPTDFPNSGFVQKRTQSVGRDGTSNAVHHFAPYALVDGPAIIKLQANASAAGVDVSAGFDAILIDNS